MKDICVKYGLPTAAYRRFTDLAAAKAYVEAQGAPIVIKTDGLAAGKGVTVAENLPDALAAVEAAMADGVFGNAGAELVIEEVLVGEEASFLALVDGDNILPLASSQDHKRALDGDRGPNTGGMGAYSPAPVVTPEVERRIMAEVMEPLVAGMKAEGRPYKGLLYAGLMIAADGSPQVVEFNVRFGDPECEAVLMRLKSDFLPALIASCDGQLKTFDLRWYDEPAMTVVLAAEGYPGPYAKGSEIKGLTAAEGDGENVKIFHAGTKAGPEDTVLANGGRVLAVTALGSDIAEARQRAYGAVDLIDWPEGFCRRDIGWRAL